ATERVGAGEDSAGLSHAVGEATEQETKRQPRPDAPHPHPPCSSHQKPLRLGRLLLGIVRRIHVGHAKWAHRGHGNERGGLRRRGSLSACGGSNNKKEARRKSGDAHNTSEGREWVPARWGRGLENGRALVSWPSRSGALICCRAVDRWERHIVQAEVHAELPAMMNEMVDVRAHYISPRQGHEDTVAMLERPHHREVGVLGSRERL